MVIWLTPLPQLSTWFMYDPIHAKNGIKTNSIFAKCVYLKCLYTYDLLGRGGKADACS